MDVRVLCKIQFWPKQRTLLLHVTQDSGAVSLVIDCDTLHNIEDWNDLVWFKTFAQETYWGRPNPATWLGVMLDCELSMKQHVTKVASSCFYHLLRRLRRFYHLLRRLKQIWQVVGKEVTAQLVSVFILSHLDYCNALLAGLQLFTTDPLQWVQNVAARHVLNLRLRDHVTPVLKQLHWLPVASRIKFKLRLLMHRIHLAWALQYLVDCVQPVNTSSIRHIRSFDTTDYLKWTTRTKFGERGFSYSGPAALNSLPPHLCTITDTNAFKRHLKSLLFT